MNRSFPGKGNGKENSAQNEFPGQMGVLFTPTHHRQPPPRRIHLSKLHYCLLQGLPLSLSAHVCCVETFHSISIISVLANRHLSSFNLDHHPSSPHLSNTWRKPLGDSCLQSSSQTWLSTSHVIPQNQTLKKTATLLGFPGR